MTFRFNLKTFLYTTLITFLFAFLGGIITYLGMPSFDALAKPPLSPPSFLFPIVWTILYLLMSVGAAIVYDNEAAVSSKALFVYIFQLTLNFWWCVLFFGFRLYLVAFIWLVLLLITVLLMIIMFYRVKPIAGLIQLPYLLWLGFAAYLNLAIWIIN